MGLLKTLQHFTIRTVQPGRPLNRTTLNNKHLQSAMAPTVSDARSTAPIASQSQGRTLGTNLNATLQINSRHWKTLDAQRDNLRDKIESLWNRLRQIEHEYWAVGLAATEQYLATHRSREPFLSLEWQGEHAKERSLGAKRVREARAAIRQQIWELEKEFDRVDASYWASIQSTFDNIAAQSQPASQTMNLQPPKRKPKPRAPPPPNPSKSDSQTSKNGRRTKRVLRIARTGIGSFASSTISPVSESWPARGPRYRPSPPAAQPRTTNRPDPISRPRNKTKTPAPKPTTRPNPNTFQGVANAAPGQCYQAYYPSSGSDEGWYTGLVLPWDGDQWEESIAVQFSMRQIDLETDWPACYIPDVVELEQEDKDGKVVKDTIIKGIKGWAPGYEDGGPLAQERVFLFLWFVDTSRYSVKLRVPKNPETGTKVTFTQAEIASGKMPFDWVPAANLRPLEVDVGSAVQGRATMKKFKQMLHQLDTVRQQNVTAHHSLSASEAVDDGQVSSNDHPDVMSAHQIHENSASIATPQPDLSDNRKPDEYTGFPGIYPLSPLSRRPSST